MYKTEKSFDVVQGKVPDFRKCSVAINQGFNFDFSGNEQTFEVQCDGNYKLEIWGASGGTIEGTIPGYGGYATGEIILTQGEKLYIYVGGTTTTQTGGYNGGGKGGSAGGQSNYGGGGATHIALVSGLLSTLEKQKDQILIVAGGGGSGVGQLTNVAGGSGGGFTGANGANTPGGSARGGTGGTQTSGGYSTRNPSYGKGSFGKGGDFYSTGYGGGGGGAGFYGGGGTNRGHASGGGGSGYIGNPSLTNKIMYCYNCTESEEEETKTKTTNNVSSDATSEYAKIGSGYAKITYLGTK